MRDDETFKRPQAKWEPGTLDKTRKNIGEIDKSEAARMTKILGGEIFTEKSVPINYDSLPKKNRAIVHRSSAKTSGDVASSLQKKSDAKKSSTEKKSQEIFSQKNSSATLPPIPQKVRQKIDRLMMSDSYKIKPNFGLFNFVRFFIKNGTEKFSQDFIDHEIPAMITHLQGFTVSIKNLVQIFPDSYKARILSDDDAKFRLLKSVSNWSLRDVKYYASVLQEKSSEMSIPDSCAFIKSFYKLVLKIFYLGEEKIANYIKEICNELAKFPKVDGEKILKLGKQAVVEWLFVYSSAIKKLYPILMRFCGTNYFEFPEFFTICSAEILDFLQLTKFDIELPKKKSSEKKSAEENQSSTQNSEEKSEAKKNTAQKEPGEKTAVVETGLKLLEKLFPQAGFLHPEKMPDLFPYFQPIYEFSDGFNVLSPQNAMQFVAVLLAILQDLFQGMRNINFNIEADDPVFSNQGENFISVLNEWSVYKENLFEKNYCDQLLHFVNQQYTQSDFRTSQLGKKIMTKILWQTKYNFLPHFEFEQLLLEKPANDIQFKPLCLHTDFLRTIFTEFSKRIDAAAEQKSRVVGIENAWEKYEFDIPNAVSKRMDVLLGAKRPTPASNATNASLIKYAMCIISVLDWWVNNRESPAYTSGDSKRLYRVSEKDGAPQFGVQLRTDQNRLFAQSIKAALQK